VVGKDVDGEVKEPRFRTPYARQALEWVAIATIAGIGASLVAIVAAMAYWAWTA
jgi:hypothetical protein